MYYPKYIQYKKFIMRSYLKFNSVTLYNAL